MNFVETSRSQTTGAADPAKMASGRATRIAITSGFLRAIWFGTSSPMMSDRYATATTTMPIAAGFA